MARQGFASGDINEFPSAAIATVNTTTTETSIVSNTAAIISQFCQISNNDARSGKMYLLRAGGVLGTSSSAPTIIWTPRWGNSATMSTNISLGASTTITMTASLAAVPWYAEFVFGLRTGGIGATAGSGTGTGFVSWGGAAAAASVVAAIGGSVATIDVTGSGTAGCGLQLTVTWGTSAAANTFTTNYCYVQSLN